MHAQARPHSTIIISLLGLQAGVSPRIGIKVRVMIRTYVSTSELITFVVLSVDVAICGHTTDHGSRIG